MHSYPPCRMVFIRKVMHVAGTPETDWVVIASLPFAEVGGWRIRARSRHEERTYWDYELEDHPNMAALQNPEDMAEVIEAMLIVS